MSWEQPLIARPKKSATSALPVYIIFIAYSFDGKTLLPEEAPLKCAAKIAILNV
jgi:hypothetical protein